MTTDFLGFKAADWTAIRKRIDVAASLTSQLLLIVGEQQGPSLYSAILDLDAALLACQALFARQEDDRSGQGEMQYQIVMLESFDVLVDAAVRVVRCVRDTNTAP
jgi:hypothetical protein